MSICYHLGIAGKSGWKKPLQKRGEKGFSRNDLTAAIRPGTEGAKERKMQLGRGGMVAGSAQLLRYPLHEHTHLNLQKPCAPAEITRPA